MNDKRFWVFGYGSLLWKPGFTYQDRQPATLTGYRRGFCMLSYHYRGTKDSPGLVLALDEAQGHAVRGLAFLVEGEQAPETLAYLRERELVSYAYDETLVSLKLETKGEEVEALAYIVRRDHEQYYGWQDLEEQARIIQVRGERPDRIATTCFRQSKNWMSLVLTIRNSRVCPGSSVKEWLPDQAIRPKPHPPD
jgi:cation transport protein ChaC